jgi:hypothetical protein
MIDLHTATASADGVGVAVDGVEADVDVVAAGAGEELVLTPPALLGAATEVLWLLDVELLLPQPAKITAASAIRSHAESFRIIGPPSLKRTLARRGGSPGNGGGTGYPDRGSKWQIESLPEPCDTSQCGIREPPGGLR